MAKQMTLELVNLNANNSDDLLKEVTKFSAVTMEHSGKKMDLTLSCYDRFEGKPVYEGQDVTVSGKDMRVLLVKAVRAAKKEWTLKGKEK